MFKVISSRFYSIVLLSWIFSFVVVGQTPRHFRFTENTGENNHVIVPTTANPNVNGTPLVAGDEIGAFTPAGLCVGAVVWSGSSNAAITVWGDNLQTVEIDGIRANERIYYRVWKQATDKELSTVEVTYSVGDGIYYPSAPPHVLSSLNATAPPDPPTLVSPAENATSVSVTPTFSWNASSYATSYRLQVALDSAFSALTINQAGIPGPSYVASGLAHSTRYYWRVSASNSGGSSTFSASRTFTTVDPPPAVPVLSSPLDGSANQPVALTLSWNPSSGAQSYHLQVATSSTFDTPLVDATLTGTSYDLSGLANNTTYYWRVEATNSFGSSGWSSVWSFGTIPLPPSIPTLFAPSDGAVDQPTTLTLSWNQATGASTYHVQVSTEASFGSTIVDDASLTGTTRGIGPLAANTLYYWRVQAGNTGGLSDWSSVWRFTTIPDPPSAPGLLSPPYGSENQPIPITLSWNAASGASGYRLQVSTSLSFTPTVVDDSSLTSTSTEVGTLANSTLYYWRVQARNSGGVSGWSDIWYFRTVPTPPPAPGLSSPSNGSTGQPTTLILAWNASQGAQLYHLEVSTRTDFATLFLADTSITGTSRQVTSLANSATYYWRVRAKNTGGISAWSAVWSFTTSTGLPPPPSTPTLSSPVNGATNQKMPLTFTWNSSTGASTYRLQISKNSSFDPTVVDDSSLTSTSYQAVSLEPNTRHYWRVSAKNEGGSSGWSGTWSLTTSVAPPATPVLVQPADGAVSQPINPVLRWNSVPGTSTYHVQVSASSSFLPLTYENSAVTDTSREANGLKNSTIYFWRVRASNSGGLSAWSSARTFTTVDGPPSAPSLSTPTNGAQTQPIQPLLVWKSASGATSYRVQVSTSFSFPPPLAVDVTLADTSYRANGLSYSTTYYWRANASNAGGTGAWSTIWSLSTAPEVPGAPTLVSPPNNGTNQPTALDLDWNDVTGATRYHVQLSDETAFTAPIVDQTNVTASSYPVSGLNPETTYYWHISAANAGGTGPWSSIWRFTTARADALAPTLVSPQDGANGVPTNPTLEWNSAVGAISYHVQVSRNTDFATFVVNQENISATSYTVSGLLQGTTYYWRVRAKNVAGTSDWSSIWGFTTIVPTPGAPTLALPADGARDLMTQPRLSWNTVAGASYYQIQISRMPSFSTVVIDSSNVTGTFLVVGPLENATLYYWRVIAHNSVGTGPSSSIRAFTTHNPSAQIPASFVVDFPPAVDVQPIHYRIVGLPGAPSKMLNSLLSGSNGSQWRVFWDNGLPSEYFVEFSQNETFRCGSGRGFWIIHDGPLTVQTPVPPIPLNSAGEAEIQLHNGWNIITNPFHSPVAWQSIEALNGVGESIVGYEGRWVIGDTLETYRGYYFMNATGLQYLRIPRPSSQSASRSAGTSMDAEKQEWKIQISLASGNAIDDAAWVGIDPAALKGKDPRDIHKPRTVGSIPAVVFPRPEWDPNYCTFASDFRPNLQDLEVWEFEVSSAKGKDCHLTFPGIQSVPRNYDVYLYDVQRQTSVNIRETSPYAFSPFSESAKFMLFVGEPGALRKSLPAENLASEYQLGINFPNPFNPSTVIPMSLPVGSEVTLKVYNYLGQEVATLHSGVLDRGRHFFLWNGVDDVGNPVASGVYFSRLTFREGHIVRKMILIK